ncbi:MAG: hypothetical protein LBI28_08545 [Treponema sp.]|jgi:hypothetical protein|nr:hypothetical protein [Treponema sp.]
MKKHLFFLLIFFSLVLQVHGNGQNDRVALLVNRCISLLDQPVPAGFRYMGDAPGPNTQVFYSDEGILLLVHNGIVTVSSVHNTFSSDNEVNKHRASFSRYLERNNWEFFHRSSRGAEIYKKDDLSAIIESPRRLNNGSIETLIGFSRSLLGLENM